MGNPLSALVIDDDELIVEAIARQLESKNYVVTRSPGDLASVRASLSRPRRFDLIVLDLMLDGTDAVELLREHASNLQGCALILISSQDERVLRSVAVLAGQHRLQVLGALRKPVRADSLNRLLAQMRPAAPTETRSAMRPPQADDLGAALQRGGIFAHAQPKLRLSDGLPCGVELLARWQAPSFGAVGALDLLGLAERSGQEAALNDYMLSLAARTCAELWQAGLRIPVSVNLAGEALRRTDLPNRIERMLATADLQPSMLTVEFQECVILDEINALDVLTRLRLRGVRIALDRFGSGLGSLVRLQRLPINEIKIAPSFVRSLSGGGMAVAFVEQIIRLGKALALDTVGVGVECEAQAALLRDMGCDQAQGRHLGEPMPVSELCDWWQRHPARIEGVAA